MVQNTFILSWMSQRGLPLLELQIPNYNRLLDEDFQGMTTKNAIILGYQYDSLFCK